MKKLFCFSLIFMFANASFSQAGWHWQNPYLQGNDLNSIVMNGVKGWAVGDLGAVMRTDDAGLNWELVDLGTSENLNCIYMAGVATDGWIVGEHGTIFYTDDAGETWTKQYAGTHESLYAVTALTGDCPWICGHNVILKSYNHGELWENIYCPFQNLWDIDQIECDEVWLCGNQGLIISTKDNGQTWQSHSTPTTHNLLSIDVDPNSDYRACGNQSLIVSSSDNGQTWVQEHQAPFINMRSVETQGIAGPAYAVGDQGHILETLDGGAIWTEKESPTLYGLNDVCFQALFHAVYAVGWYGQVLKKEESTSAQFEVLNKKPTHYFMDVDFINADTGWVAGGERLDDEGNRDGLILHTVDGGETWETQLNEPVFFSSVDFINASEGWAVGESSIQYSEGVIMHTINGGLTWTSQSNPVIGSVEKVFFLDENTGWVASADWWGQIAHTANGGDTWTLQTNPTQNPLTDVFFINPLKGWATGMDSTILYTNNGGELWQRAIIKGSNNWYFRSVYFIDELHGWAVGVYGVIMLSDDGGLTWQEIVSGFGETLQSVFFIDALNGWAVGDAGTVLRSIDGGYTWFPQYSGIRRNYLCSVQFTDLKNGWITGWGGTIKHTVNGGFWNEPGTFLRNGLSIPVQDNSTVTDTLNVDFPWIVKGGYQLTGLEVMLDSVIHSRVSDLEISLSHQGVSQKIVDQVASTGSDFLWLRLKDEATSPVSDGVAPFSGNHKPDQPLSAFAGLDPEGDWILEIHDRNPGNSGVLKAWGIKPFYDKILAIEDPVVSENDTPVQLHQNVPNPFTGITQIKWKSDLSGFTTLKLFNIHGQEIATLINKALPKGEYNIDFDGSGLSPGVYYYRLQIDNHIITRKCITM
ncbi:MAG: T9SS type A sorting domain-containing protein [Lentimicrobium sp.]|nr:T9SS type A sorting domain-containing protein [Lentimicrobium sp.]